MRRAKGIVMSGMLAVALLVNVSSAAAGDGILLGGFSEQQPEPTVNCGILLGGAVATECRVKEDKGIITIIIDGFTGILLGG